MVINFLFTTFVILLFLYVVGFSIYVAYTKERTIRQQQDTIQRLINREPVTYAEVGQKPDKPQKEVYAAWGSQMVSLNEDEEKRDGNV